MLPSRLGDYRVPSDPQMHPDGQRNVFVVTQMDLEADTYLKQIWLSDESGTRSLTSGTTDRSPRWSPDGAAIAFLRDDDDEIAQLVIMGLDGGEPSTVTSFDASVLELAWSPDGRTLAIVVKEYVDGFTDTDERLRSPRRIEAPAFRYDDKSWVYDTRKHLWLVDTESGEVRQLTSGDNSEIGPAWSPDGGSITYRSSMHERHWINPLSHVCAVSVTSADFEVVSPLGDWDWSGFDASGALLALGTITAKKSLALPQFHVLEGDGGAAVLTSVDHHIQSSGAAGGSDGPLPVPSGGLSFIAEDHGTWRAFALHLDGHIDSLASGRREITGWHPGSDSSTSVFTSTTATQPGEVYRFTAGNEDRITDFNGEFCAGARLVEPEEFTFESGGTEIHGWVYLPPGESEVPLLLNIHGGPATQYGWGFFDEFQVYAGAGYGVVAINPRGSSGYGHDHVSAVVGRWSDPLPPDFADLTAAPYEAAKRFPRLDLDRMGVMGGSYGGVATVMVTALDQAYRSAIAERGVYNWVSFAGTTDIPYFVEMYVQASMPHDVDAIWKASSLARAHAITTPTLVIHSEDDFRCPLEQGQQLFTLLYTAGVDTELLLFPPGEGHELSRSGDPRHRVERFDAILAWHDRHLGSPQ
jgi:dipeptidyl aminopeptidase/acylaminoacyl peptidase